MVVAWTAFWQYPQNMEQVIDLLIANAFLVQINIHVLAILFVTHPNKYNYFIGCLIKIIFTNNLSYAIIIIIIICDWNSLCIYWDIYIMSLNIICVCSINYVLKKDNIYTCIRYYSYYKWSELKNTSNIYRELLSTIFSISKMIPIRGTIHACKIITCAHNIYTCLQKKYDINIIILLKYIYMCTYIRIYIFYLSQIVSLTFFF